MRSSRPTRRTSARTLLHPDSCPGFLFARFRLISLVDPLFPSLCFCRLFHHLASGFSLSIPLLLSSLIHLIPLSHSYSSLARCHSYYSCPIHSSPLCCDSFLRLPLCTDSSSRFGPLPSLYRSIPRLCIPLPHFSLKDYPHILLLPHRFALS